MKQTKAEPERILNHNKYICVIVRAMPGIVPGIMYTMTNWAAAVQKRANLTMSSVYLMVNFLLNSKALKDKNFPHPEVKQKLLMIVRNAGLGF